MAGAKAQSFGQQTNSELLATSSSSQQYPQYRQLQKVTIKEELTFIFLLEMLKRRNYTHNRTQKSTLLLTKGSKETNMQFSPKNKLAARFLRDREREGCHLTIFSVVCNISKPLFGFSRRPQTKCRSLLTPVPLLIHLYLYIVYFTGTFNAL